jgi:hypothetical protein
MILIAQQYKRKEAMELKTIQQLLTEAYRIIDAVSNCEEEALDLEDLDAWIIAAAHYAENQGIDIGAQIYGEDGLLEAKPCAPTSD